MKRVDHQRDDGESGMVRTDVPAPVVDDGEIRSAEADVVQAGDALHVDDVDGEVGLGVA